MRSKPSGPALRHRAELRLGLAQGERHIDHVRGERHDIGHGYSPEDWPRLPARSPGPPLHESLSRLIYSVPITGPHKGSAFAPSDSTAGRMIAISESSRTLVWRTKDVSTKLASPALLATLTLETLHLALGRPLSEQCDHKTQIHRPFLFPWTRMNTHVTRPVCRCCAVDLHFRRHFQTFPR